MGALQTKEFTEMLEEECAATPEPKLRSLSAQLDPRSPTADITRTPIMVEKTPDNILDPRSPSNTITRTPIYSYMEKKQGKKDVQSDTALKKAVSEDSLNHPADSSLSDSLMGLAPLDLDAATDLETKLIMEVKPNPAPVPAVGSPSVKKGKDKEKTVVRKVKVKEAQKSQPKVRDNTPRSPLKMVGGVQHSPRGLCHVDSNSPRSIVQRKQASRLGMVQKSPSRKQLNLSSTKYSQLMAQDKENMHC